MAMEYSQAIKWFYSLEGRGIKFGLENIKKLLNFFGNPHWSLRVVLIAGTNGKGSVASYLSHILSCAGLKVGLYTSPHLVTLRERVCLVEKGRRRFIPKRDFQGLTEELSFSLPRIFEKENGFPTFFEVLTALAFRYFFQEEVDVAVMEVGMGGRLDATNISHPSLTLITNVSKEHTAYLGKDIPTITKEKAGTLRPFVPLLTTCEGKSLQVLKEICGEKKVPLYYWKKDFWGRSEEREGHQLLYIKGIQGEYKGLKTKLLGEWQVKNSTLAVSASEVLRKNFPQIREESVRKGIELTEWPGRMEKIPGNPPFILDGAHNPMGAYYLSKEMDKWKKRGEKILLIFGVLQDKDRKKIMSLLFPRAEKIFLTQPSSRRAVSPQVLFEESKKWRGKIYPFLRVEEALHSAKAEKDFLVLVTGSLYLVGEVRKNLLNLRGDEYVERI